MPNETYRLSRETDPRERDDPRTPIAPLNMFVTSPDVGMMDVRWDNPALILGNGKWTVLGVNLYRSSDSQWATYTKVNTVPIGTTFFRDSTQNQAVLNEDVSGMMTARGADHPEGLYIIQVPNPIVKEGSQAIPANVPSDVVVKIDGVAVPVRSVNGATGEVFLNQARIWDKVTRKLVTPVLPTLSSVVTMSYRFNTTLLTGKIGQRTFYKLTTVVDDGTGAQIETPLKGVEGVSAHEIEKLDYIWKEGIRRNRWILEQGGEAVKLFIRKWVGVRCACYSDVHKQAENDCLNCFGTSIQGGYEGPYDILIAPQDGERRIELTQNGMQVLHQYEVWTGPTPMVSQRDFIVRQNNDRYSIGAVNVPSNRGNILQQHFMIGYFGEKDIRYKVPANAEMLANLAYPQTRQHGGFGKPGAEGTVYPQINDNTNTGEEKARDGMQDRGRSPTYGRIVR